MAKRPVTVPGGVPAVVEEFQSKYEAQCKVSVKLRTALEAIISSTENRKGITSGLYIESLATIAREALK